MKNKVQHPNNTLTDLQRLLDSTLTLLDLSGNDETVTKALIIVNQAITSKMGREDIGPKKLYSRAMKIYERQKVI